MTIAAISKIEKEIRDVAGIKSRRKESRQAFLRRLVDGAGAFFDKHEKAWEELSDASQRWLNEVTPCLGSKSDIPEPVDSDGGIEDDSAEDDSAEDDSAEGDSAEPAAGQSADAPEVIEDVELVDDVEDDEEKEDPRPRHVKQRSKDIGREAAPNGSVKKKDRTPKGGKKNAPETNPASKVDRPMSSLRLLKTCVILNPRITKEDLIKKLEEQGHHPSPMTVATTRSGTLEAMKLLVELGGKLPPGVTLI